MEKKLKYIGISLLFTVIIIVVVKYVIDKRTLSENHVFTTGIVISYETLAKSGYALHYEYYVDSTKYIGEYVVYEKPKNYLNNKYKVKYNPDNPKNAEILLNVKFK